MVSTIRAEAGEGGAAPPDLVCYRAATTASGLPPGAEVGEEAWRLGSHCLFFITQNSGHAVKNLLLGDTWRPARWIYHPIGLSCKIEVSRSTTLKHNCRLRREGVFFVLIERSMLFSIGDGGAFMRYQPSWGVVFEPHSSIFLEFS
jgi:hypothetical protein